MPTPEIDNTPEQIDVPDTLPVADQIPDTLTPDQASETLTSGTDNPQPQIEQKATNLVEVLNRLQNLTVDNFFAANPSDDPTIAEQRAYFKDGLTIDTEADNLISAFIKFYALNTFIGVDSNFPEIFTVPFSTVNDELRYKPQVHLYFVETNYDFIQQNRRIRDGAIRGIRLMGETSETITQVKVEAIANKIKDLFGDGQGFTWNKGRAMFTYADDSKGYNLQILCTTSDEGKRIVTQVLAIQEHEPEWKYANFKENNSPDEAYPVDAPDITILDKPVKAKKKRLNCTVTFRTAWLHLDAIEKPITLYDKTGRYSKPTVTD
jgi:hypothetical protein